MKKHGFTLAEVLITLGIVGVVAALTAPALVQNAGSAQIGPKLAKAVSTFEIANENLLTTEGSNSLASISATPGSSATSIENYVDSLSNYMKISYYDESSSSEKYETLLANYDGSKFTFISGGGLQAALYSMHTLYAKKNLAISKDGVLYGIGKAGTSTVSQTPQKSPFGIVLIDVNGITKPNRLGKDVFAFLLMQDGSLRPVGSSSWASTALGDDTLNTMYNWKTGTSDKCNETSVTSGWTCAGSIYENNQKVIYQ